jgi:polyribonucleotide nucleotidyltransferase
MQTKQVTARVGDKEITFGTGTLAQLADGAVTVQAGETVLLTTVVSEKKIRDGQSWFPLSVEYKEKASAAGRFPGGYFKREGRPSEKEILTCRVTDRPLRPLFPKGYLYDTQIICILLAADGINDSDILAMNGASAALTISDIPFNGPIGAVRVGRVDGQFVVNPTNEEREESDLDLIYAGTRDQVIMIEGGADELPESDFIAAIQFAKEQASILIHAQEELRQLAGKPKREAKLFALRDDVMSLVREIAGDRIEDAIYQNSKEARGTAIGILQDEVSAAAKERIPDATSFDVEQAFDVFQAEAFRRGIFEKGRRADGRGVGDLRQLIAQARVLPRVHGSALFARGETQALAIATLAPSDEVQFLDAYTGGQDSKRFLLHYNFPPFSVGETGRMGGINRREIGHGDLAERSILPVIPEIEDFPYAIRVSSEVLMSNGSTSMASVCSGSMALFDAGVPLKRAVAGISVGLVTEKSPDGQIDRHLCLLDILGQEDFFGDMDFKLCGTSEGVTGFQLDLKLPGIPLSILEEAIHKATEARSKVLEVMNAAIAEKAEMSEHAPRIEVLKINPEKIGELIGPGGKNIKAIQAESGAEVNIENDGTIFVYSTKKESLDRAVEMISAVSAEIEVGKTYTGPVVSTTNFGAFMRVLPGKDGMIHISELSHQRVNAVEDVVRVGDIVTATCIGVDDRGRVKMSRKAALDQQGN